MQSTSSKYNCDSNYIAGRGCNTTGSNETDELNTKLTDEETGIININNENNIFFKKNIDYVKGSKIGKYKLIKTLGKGSCAKVVQAEDCETGEYVAIKIVERTPKQLSDIRIYREALICSLFNHPHIIKLLDFFHTTEYFFLIFEYVNGQQLYDIVLKKGSLDEDEARKYFRQIISAVDYTHRNSVVHRDLKIENILIDRNDNIKLIDFGLSNFYDNDDLLGTFCGSLYFAAPELLLGTRYTGPEIDVWSLGVILYVMLVGKVPFDDENIHALQNKIKSCKFKFEKTISPEAQDLITNMILSSDARINLENVKKSKWINLGYKNLTNNFMTLRKPISEINKNILRALQAAMFFQFTNMEHIMMQYLQICKSNRNLLEQTYWCKKPIVILYYLTMEKFDELNYKSIPIDIDLEIDTKSLIDITIEKQPTIIYNFVRFTNAKKNDNPYNLFFSKSAFEPEMEFLNIAKDMSLDSCNDTKEESKKHNFPKIKQSIIKGLFKGIKIKNGDKDYVKNAIIKILLDLDITYEANEKSYFCSYSHSEVECHFKIDLYFNILLLEHYVVLNCLNKKKDNFKLVTELIKEKLEEIGDTSNYPENAI